MCKKKVEILEILQRDKLFEPRSKLSMHENDCTVVGAFNFEMLKWVTAYGHLTYTCKLPNTH